MLVVPAADIRQDGKRRVVDNHAAVRVALFLIVSAGEEGTDNIDGFQFVVLQAPGLYGFVDVHGCVAVVARALWLKLVQKLLVLFRVFSLFLPEVVRLNAGQLNAGSVEADQGDIKAGSLESLRFGPEGVLVVAGLAEQVVRVDEGAPLLLGQVFDRDGRHLRPAFRLGCQQPAVSVDHAVLAVDADRDNHAKLAEGSAERFNLLRWMKFGVAFVWMQLGDLPGLHPCDCSHVASVRVRDLCPRFVSAARAPRAQELYKRRCPGGFTRP